MMIRWLRNWIGYPDQQIALLWIAVIILFHWLGFLSWYVATQIE